MMEIKASKGKMRIVAEEPEAEFLAKVLKSLADKYAIPPSELDGKTGHVWYSSDGFKSANMSREEREEWNRSLHEFRGENRRKLEEWISALGAPSFPVTWILDFAEAETLLMVINDHRLGLAAKHDVAEHEMEHDLDRVKDPAKRGALFEIHVLSWMMERILHEFDHPS